MARSAAATTRSKRPPMRRAAIVAGLRTPFIRAGTDFAQLDVLELARSVTVELLLRSGLDANDVDHVIYGNVTRPVQYSNIARELVLAAGLPKSTPADTVTLACASACQAITDATTLIERGYADVVIAGGVGGWAIGRRSRARLRHQQRRSRGHPRQPHPPRYEPGKTRCAEAGIRPP